MTVSPYIWRAGVKRTAGTFPGLPAVDVDADFKDILKNLDLAGMMVAELRYRRLPHMDLVLHQDRRGPEYSVRDPVQR